MNRSRSVAALAPILFLAGCGPAAPVLGPVKGRVSVAGKPLAGGTIGFENKAAGVARTASIGDDGRYEVAAYNANGLPPGAYTVTVNAGRFLRPGEEIQRIGVAGPGAGPSQAPKLPVTVPTKYAKSETSGLTAEVVAGDNSQFDFDLKP